jgi:hypothetical protein
MNSNFELNDLDLEAMANDIETISAIDESEIFRIIGNSLFREGYSIDSSDENTNTIGTHDLGEIKLLQIKPSLIQNTDIRTISALKSVRFINQPLDHTPEDAESEGKKFWEKFKQKLKEEICSNERIREMILGNGSLKDYLLHGIPIVMVALGIAALNPVILAIIVSVFALIIKVGFQAYCDLMPA